jgi:hypothetical protein
MRRRFGPAIATATILLLSGWGAQAQASETLRVAVAPVEARDVPADLVRAVEELIATELSRRPELSTISDEDVRRLLALVAQQQLLGGAGDESGLGHVADVLDVDRIVRGSLARLEGSWFVSLAMLDARDGQVVSRATRRVAGERDALIDALPVVVGELLEIPARVQLSRQVAGGRLYLDDAFIGEMPLSPFPVRGSGRASLRAEHYDHADFSTEIDLVPGRTTRVLLDMPSYAELQAASTARRRLAWAALFGGAAAGGLGGFAATEGWSAKRDYDAMDVRRVSQSELDAAARRSAGLIWGGYAGLGVAAVLVGTGVYLLVDDPHRARLELSGGGGGLTVAF